MKAPTFPSWLSWVLRLLGTVVVVGLVLQGIEPGGAWFAMQQAPAWIWILPGLLLLGVSFIHALRLRILLMGIGVPCAWGAALGAILRGQFVGLVLPRGGGDLARLAWLSRHTGRSDAVVAAGVGARVLEVFPWMLLLLYGLVWGLLDWSRPLGLCAMAFAVVFGLLLFLTAMIVHWDGLRWLTNLRMGQAWLRRLANSVQALGHAPSSVVWALVLTVPAALLNVGVVTLVLAGFDVHLPYTDVMALAPAADTVIALPITINGIGLRESAFEILLQPLNVTGEVAVAVALTRWVGEIQRAGLGGVLFLIGDRVETVETPDERSD